MADKDNNKSCMNCKHKGDLAKHPYDRCLNCQQCAAAEKCVGIKFPSWEPANGC